MKRIDPLKRLALALKTMNKQIGNPTLMQLLIILYVFNNDIATIADLTAEFTTLTRPSINRNLIKYREDNPAAKFPLFRWTETDADPRRHNIRLTKEGEELRRRVAAII